jgi:lipoprotein-anchoring transpeptidase ErfK/SrfK
VGALAPFSSGTVSGGGDAVSPDAAAPAAAASSSTIAVVTSTPASTSTIPTAAAPAAVDTTIDAADVGSVDDETGCRITERSIGGGSTGASVSCLQTALIAAGYLSGTPTGTYDGATAAAVRTLQTEKDLFVDGIAGRETGLALGIWPDEASLVVHTPAPPKGTLDLLGYPLSSVASAGSDAPPLPENSGTGRRLVYSRAGQRIWAVDKNERVVRSWLVSGSKYGNELPGTHEVYSRSEVTTAWNGKAYLHKMVRWLKTERGNIGFHSIPIHVSDGTVYQTEAELGQRLSGGCQRQAPLDAAFVWDFAQVGTKVVVI